MRCFISYSHVDEAFVRDRLASGLKLCGHTPWYDTDIPAGDDWWNTICENIEVCDVFIFVISPDSVASTACCIEFAYADDLGKNVIPVCLKSADLSLIPGLQSIQYINFSNDHESLRKLQDLCKHISVLNAPSPLPDSVSRPPAPLTKLQLLADELREPELTETRQLLAFYKLKQEIQEGTQQGEAFELLRRFQRRNDLSTDTRDMIFDLVKSYNNVPTSTETSEQLRPASTMIEHIIDEVSKLAEECAEKHRSNNKTVIQDIIHEQISHILQNTKRLLEDLSYGQFETTYWDTDILTQMIEHMSPDDSLIGITHWDDETDREWWYTEDAADFLRANETAIKRGCVIQRIFVYSENSEEFQDQLYRHHQLGVEVYFVERWKLPNYNVFTSNVIGSDLTYEARTDTIEKQDKNVFSVSQRDIEQTRQKLDIIRRRAERYR